MKAPLFSKKSSIRNCLPSIYDRENHTKKLNRRYEAVKLFIICSVAIIDYKSLDPIALRPYLSVSLPI